MLTVSTPALKQNGASGKPFVSETPIQLECSSVKLPDGTLVTPENIIKSGFLTQRRQLGGSIETWDQTAKQWTSSSTGLDPEPLFYKDNVWQSLIVAIGQKDQSNQEDKFATNRLIGFPQYSVQCVFQARDSTKQEHMGVSQPSALVQISGVGEQDCARFYIEPKMDPSSATEIGMLLKDTLLVAERGRISIKEDSGGFRIQVVCSESRIEILPNGEIVLTPKPGQPVRVAGDLEIAGTLKIGGAVSIAGTVNIDESVSIGKALNVIGKVTALNVP